VSAQRVAILACALLWAAASLGADTVYLKDGDRVSGKVGASGKNARQVVTPYGRLLLPDEVIDRIVYADGREERLAPVATPTPPPTHLDLFVTILGDSFWQAWDPREAPEDPSLRLVSHLDGRPFAAYVDAELDEDIEGATVNTFAFDPAQTSRTQWQGAKALPPQASRGRVRLHVELPLDKAGPRHLRLTYQANGGSREAPEWRDIQETSLDVVLGAAAPLPVRLEQSRGEMSFGGAAGKGRMRKAETFKLRLLLDHEFKAEDAETAGGGE
jgi:hypothetical protein